MSFPKQNGATLGTNTNTAARAGGAYLQHIMQTTGASVQLRGQGSGTMEGPDPLHVHVAAPTLKQLEDARKWVARGLCDISYVT